MNVEMMRVEYTATRGSMSPSALASTRCRNCSAYPCKLNPFLSADTVETLSQRGVTRTFKNGHCGAGVDFSDLAGSLNILVRGHAMAEHHSPEGARTVLRFYRPGDVIHIKPPGETASTIGFKGGLVFRPLSQVVLCVVPMAMLSHESELEGLIDLACGEICSQYAQQILLGKMTAYQRLAYFLFHECVRERAGGSGGADDWEHGPVALVLPMVRADIADHLGVNLETVSRSFTRLKRDGLITLPKPNTVIIPEPGALKALFETAL